MIATSLQSLFLRKTTMKNLRILPCLVLLPFYLVAMEKAETAVTKVNPFYAVLELKNPKKITPQLLAFFKTIPPHLLKDLRPYQLYALLLQHTLFPDITNSIAQFLMELEYGYQEDFIQQLIIKKIPHTEIKKKEWKLPRQAQESFDKKYYVAWTHDNKVAIYNHTTKEHIFTIPTCGEFILFETKNMLLHIPQSATTPTNQDLTLYDLDTQKSYILMSNMQHIFEKDSYGIQISNDEEFILIAKDNKIHHLNITDLKNITYQTYDHPNVEHISFSPDDVLFASSSSDNDTTVIQLWKSDNNGLTHLCSYTKNFCHNYLIFTDNGKKLIVGHDTAANQSFCHLIGIEKICTPKGIEYHLQEIEHKKLCSSVTWYLSSVASSTPAVGTATTILSSNNDRSSNALAVYESPEMTIDFDYNIYTIYPSPMQRPTYKISISPDEKTMTLILGIFQNNVYSQKIIVIHQQKSYILKDWSCAREHCQEYSDKMIEFNQASTLLLRNVKKEGEYTYLLHNVQGEEVKKIITDNEYPASFHPNGRSLLSGTTQFKFCSKKDEKVLEKMAKSSFNNYLLLNNVVCHNILCNEFYKHAFDQMPSDEQTFCIESFKHIDFVKK